MSLGLFKDHMQMFFKVLFSTEMNY